jgi:hypothetical protein
MQTSMTKKRTDYISYLLRIWKSNGEGKTAWQASLENPHTGERLGFANLYQLFTFLEQQIETATQPASERNTPRNGSLTTKDEA